LILAGHLIFLSGLLVAKAGRSMLRHYKDVPPDVPRDDDATPVFFVSVADKGVGVIVSGLESTVAGWVCKC